MQAKDRLIAVFAVALLVVLAVVWFIPTGLQQAPTVTLPGINGKKISLADYRGRPYIVTFWATTCPGCIKEIPHLVKLHQDYASRGFDIVAISMAYDPPSQVITLVRKRQLPYTIAMDLEGEAARAFGDVQLTPTNFLIGPDGRILHRKIGEYTEQDMTMLRQQIEAYLVNPGQQTS
jgi:peroxiredoxin